MAVDVLFKVGHTAVTDFHCVAVKDLVQHVALWELFVEDLKESPSDVSGNIFAERGIIRGIICQLAELKLVQLIDKCTGEQHLREREAQWAYRLRSIYPQGLNSDDFFCSRNPRRDVF